MVIKCKPRGRVEVEEEQAYQIDDPIPSKVIIDTGIPSNLCSISREVDIIELSRQYLVRVFKSNPIQSKPLNQSNSNWKPIKTAKSLDWFGSYFSQTAWIGSDFGLNFQNRSNPIQTE